MQMINYDDNADNDDDLLLHFAPCTFAQRVGSKELHCHKFIFGDTETMPKQITLIKHQLVNI